MFIVFRIILPKNVSILNKQLEYRTFEIDYAQKSTTSTTYLPVKAALRWCSFGLVIYTQLNQEISHMVGGSLIFQFDCSPTFVCSGNRSSCEFIRYKCRSSWPSSTNVASLWGHFIETGGSSTLNTCVVIVSRSVETCLPSTCSRNWLPQYSMPWHFQILFRMRMLLTMVEFSF